MWLQTAGVRLFGDLPEAIKERVKDRIPLDQNVTFLIFQTHGSLIQCRLPVVKVKEKLVETEGILSLGRCLLCKTKDGFGSPTIDSLLPNESIKSRRQILVQDVAHLAIHYIVPLALMIPTKENGKEVAGPNGEKIVHEEIVVIRNKKTTYLWVVIGKQLEVERLTSASRMVNVYLSRVFAGKKTNFANLFDNFVLFMKGTAETPFLPEPKP